MNLGSLSVTQPSELYRLTKDDLKPACMVLTSAFLNNPIGVWQIPDESERLVILPNMWKVTLCIGLKLGEVYAPSKNLEGIAMWLPPEIVDVSFWKFIKCGGLKLPFKFGLRRIRKMLHVQRFHDSTRKKYIDPPYWHFGPFGVDPEFQGKGYGSKLLRPMLARIDEDDLPIYLETNKEKNVQLYQHFGFEIAEEKTIPQTEITNWGMIRKKSSIRLT